MKADHHRKPYVRCIVTSISGSTVHSGFMPVALTMCSFQKDEVTRYRQPIPSARIVISVARNGSGYDQAIWASPQHGRLPLCWCGGLWCLAMPKHRRQQAAFLTETTRSLFARKIRNALLVNAAVLAALRAKENVWCQATMLTASIPEVVAAATVAWSIFSVQLARGRNTHPLLRVSLAAAQRPAPRKQIAEKRVWSVTRASALSRDALIIHWVATSLRRG
jgi:hypothetical protein